MPNVFRATSWRSSRPSAVCLGAAVFLVAKCSLRGVEEGHGARAAAVLQQPSGKCVEEAAGAWPSTWPRNTHNTGVSCTGGSSDDARPSHRPLIPVSDSGQSRRQTFVPTMVRYKPARTPGARPLLCPSPRLVCLLPLLPLLPLLAQPVAASQVRTVKRPRPRKPPQVATATAEFV